MGIVDQIGRQPASKILHTVLLVYWASRFRLLTVKGIWHLVDSKWKSCKIAMTWDYLLG